MSAPGDEIAGDECAVMSQPMMSCPFTEKNIAEFDTYIYRRKKIQFFLQLLNSKILNLPDLPGQLPGWQAVEDDLEPGQYGFGG